MKTSTRRHVLAALALAACVVGGPASAQSWPAKPITMVVPFPPGGPTDLVARVLAQKLGEQLGQNVVVDNKGGANGNIGAAVRGARAGRRLHDPLQHVLHHAEPGALQEPAVRP